MNATIKGPQRVPLSRSEISKRFRARHPARAKDQNMRAYLKRKGKIDRTNEIESLNEILLAVD